MSSIRAGSELGVLGNRGGTRSGGMDQSSYQNKGESTSLPRAPLFTMPPAMPSKPVGAGIGGAVFGGAQTSSVGLSPQPVRQPLAPQGVPQSPVRLNPHHSPTPSVRGDSSSRSSSNNNLSLSGNSSTILSSLVSSPLRPEAPLPVTVTVNSGPLSLSGDPVGTVESPPKSSDNHLAFQNPSMLLAALSIPLVVVLVFGGKPTTLTLAFGSLIAYIFDILGSIEGSLMIVLITAFGMWTSLVWAAREILKQSMYNFSILIVMGVLLGYAFLTLASFFRSVRNEFESSFAFLESLMVATIPLIASVLITWFTCTELPELDLPTVFSTSYFVYVLLLCNPAYPSQKSKALSPKMVLAVYAVPVYFAPFVHGATNHHALYRSVRIGSLHQLGDLAASALYPLLLMTIAAEQHTGYYTQGRPNNISTVVGVTKLIAFCGLLLSMQSHPYFAELKAASSLGEPYITLVYMAIAVLTGLGISVSSRSSSNPEKSGYSSQINQGLGGKDPSAQPMTYTITVKVIAGAVCALLGIACRLPKFVVAVSAFGGILYSEYCQNWSGYGRGWVPWLVGQALVFTAGSCASIAALSATGPSLYFLDVDFAWHGVEVDIKQLCIGFMCLASFVLTVASLALQARPAQTNPGKIAYSVLPTSRENLADFGFPGSGGSGTTSGWQDSTKTTASTKAVAATAASNYFSVAYTFVIIVVSAFELFVREQNWEAWETQTEDVYPAFLVGSTALTVGLLSFRLYSRAMVSPAFLWVCLSVQAFKVLHLIGLQSNVIAASLGLFLAYTLPFVIHRNLLGAEASTGALKTASNLNPRQTALGFGHLWGYFVVCVTSTAFARINLLHVLLEVILLRDVTHTQSSAASIALMAAFSAILLYAFRRSASMLRTFLLAVAAVCVLIVSDTLPLVLDTDSPTLLVFAQHPDLYDDSGLYLVLSVVLLLLAAGGVIAVRRPISRFLFMIMLTFCSGKALSGWAFPMSLSVDSPHFGYLQVPALYSFGSALLAVNAALSSALPMTGRGVGDGGEGTAGASETLPFLGLSLLPMAALLYTFIAKEPEHHEGIIWGAFVVNALTAFATRCTEIGKGGAPASSGQKALSSSAATTVGTMATALAIAWNVLGSLTTPHVDADISVPLSFLLLICTKRNMFVRDTHPLALAAVASACFWLLSIFYSVFIKNFGLDNKPSEFEPR